MMHLLLFHFHARSRWTTALRPWGVVLLFSGLSYLLTSSTLFAQAPTKLWDKRFGGTASEQLNSLQQTSDGGYILGGYSTSTISGDKTEAGRGSEDYWVVKVDASGTKQWDKRFGGAGSDVLASLQQTSDGGYILGGYSNSGISGDKTQASQGFYDYWVVKIDAAGIKQWDKRYGGAEFDQLYSLQQTSDGGYILGGYSYGGTSGDRTEDSRGNSDYWLVKVDASGTKQWDKRFGGAGEDLLFSMQKTSDGGYILGGYSESGIGGDKTQAARGVLDYWVVKVDASGTKQWDKRFGGTGNNQLYSLQQTSDGGYILGGYTNSGLNGDKTQASQGGNDYWVVKIDASGTKQWDKRFGGAGTDQLYSLQQTSDGGYILGGYSASGISGDKTEASWGSNDYWLVKVDASGTKQWDKRFGGTSIDQLYSLQQTSDGGYIFGGFSSSGFGDDKTQTSQGVDDYWVVKTGPEICAPTFMPTVTQATCAGATANSNGTITLTAYGGGATKVGYSAGSTYTGPAFASATTLTAAPVTVTNTLANPTAPQPYTIRVFRDASCYKDSVVLLQPKVCISADVSLTILPVTQTNSQGELQTYVATVTNAGPDTAPAVKVRIPMPANRTFLSASPQQGTYSAGTAIWDVGSVPVGTKTMTFTLKIN